MGRRTGIREGSVQTGKKKRDLSAPEATVHTITDLEQVRILADPLRMRILEALCEEPRTTKQVAELFGEKATKFYHHVEALQRVGLIRLVKTQPKRGTLEKYYQAVARSFRADPSLFSAERSEVNKSLHAALMQLFEKTLEDLGRFEPSGEEEEEQALAVHLRITAGRKKIESIGEDLQDLVSSIQDEDEEEEEEPSDLLKYGLTIAYYPIRGDRRPEAGGRKPEERSQEP